MRTLLFIFTTALFTIILTIGSYIFFDSYLHLKPFTTIPTSEGITDTPIPKPLEKYSIENLAKRTPTATEITIDEPIATNAAFMKYTFHYISDGKKVTGVATVPIRNVLSPVIVQFRGYVDPNKYFPGEGTQRSAEVFAKNGFISLAPDFFGYGGSDSGAHDPFENRFQTYTAALDLIAAIPTIPFADPKRVGIWGHSNGGHIALTVAEILETKMPVSVWAPVTKYFPYSILYYMDEASDGGKVLRRELSKFEALYDSNQFALEYYLDRFSGPIQLHQGSADAAVPKLWNDEFVVKLKKLDKDITYFEYPSADHNLQPSWSTVVERDVEFFKKTLNK